MFKNLTGGLKSHTTKIGLLALAGVIGHTLTTVSSGGPVDWKEVGLGAVVAVLGALAKDNAEPAKP